MSYSFKAYLEYWFYIVLLLRILGVRIHSLLTLLFKIFCFIVITSKPDEFSCLIKMGILQNYGESANIKIEPRCDKTGLRGFRPGPTETGLYNHRRWLEA